MCALLLLCFVSFTIKFIIIYLQSELAELSGVTEKQQLLRSVDGDGFNDLERRINNFRAGLKGFP